MDNFPPLISWSCDDNDSDEDLILYMLLSVAQDMVPDRGGSSNVEKKHKKWINRDREAAHELLVRDYFVVDSLYDLLKFEERFRISRNLFLRIARDLVRNYEFFQLRWDARGKRGITTIQKYMSALRQLAYSIAADASYEYLKMSERMGRECTYLFCEYVIEIYRDIYLRHPTKSDVEQLYVVHQAKHGFPWMLGSIDFTYWEWANCPNKWHGLFTRGDHGVPTVILEADGKAPEMSYVVNGNEYKYEYHIGDGIYPEYATFVKSYTFPANNKRKMFKLVQESARNDIERAFGVLKQKWHIIKHPARTWDREKLTTVLTVLIQVGSPAYFSRVLEIQNRKTNHNLRHDLTEYIWERQFQGQNDSEDDEDDDGDDEEDDDGGDEEDEDGDDETDDIGDDNDDD
ncbi:uncharacterized protein LOC111894348 [Lactuca sativa]|uniref:uncharacterized protein LOC111894348 n=1 Tax=Lactuca sativa TaxID=4236 RepID=UPI000CD9DD3E|nr:uncharacterized protein LOC111894348 [Lactuca sativa]